MEAKEEEVFKQDWLIQWENPLRKASWSEFFANLPKTCGVYQFETKDGQTLYVGQSKNLSHRLKSYRHVHPERSSRKLLQLVHEADVIKYEVCETEAKTRVLEAKRIQELRPKHNRVFTHPESNRYIGFQIIEQDRWRWSVRSDPGDLEKRENGILFGAFSGSSVRHALASIRRMELFHQRKTLKQEETPLGFFDEMVPDKVSFDLSLEPNLTHGECQRLVRKVNEFLEGKNDGWLHRIYGKSAQRTRQCPDPWVRNRWLQDFDQLQRFFNYQTHRNREYATRFPISRKEPIGIQQLDLLKARAYGVK